MNNPQVTIVIPVWNAWQDTAQCLDSLQKIIYPNYEVMVIDNGSTDRTAELIKNNFPSVILIENQTNLGFAAACNQGIKLGLERGADYILLLNNDTVVTPDFLVKMIEAATFLPAAGIIGAKIYYFDQPKKIWFAGADFIWWRVSGKHRFWQKTDKRALNGIKDSDFITGCAMLIKKEVFLDIGFFYEPYFLTVEDLDFCWRAKKAGWKIVVNLDAKIWHKISRSRLGEFSYSNGYYGTRNRLFLAFKRLKKKLSGLVFLLGVIPARLIQWLFQGKTQMAKGALAGIIDFFKNKMGKK